MPQALESTAASVETLTEFYHLLPILNGVPILLKTRGPIKGPIVKCPKVAFNTKTEGIIERVKGIVSRVKSWKS